MNIEVEVSAKDLGDQLYWQDEDELVETIQRLDLRWGDIDFTKRLIYMLADSLRNEGLSVVVQITEE